MERKAAQQNKNASEELKQGPRNTAKVNIAVATRVRTTETFKKENKTKQDTID